MLRSFSIIQYIHSYLHECTITTEPVPRIDEHHTDKPAFGSYCHAWTAAATVLLPMGISGIKPTKRGFDEAEIKPYFECCDRFKCVVPTPKGEIAVKYENNKFYWNVPKGINAKIIIDNKVVSTEKAGYFRCPIKWE